MFTKFVQLETSSSMLAEGLTDSHDESLIHFLEICDVPNIVRFVACLDYSNVTYLRSLVPTLQSLPMW